MPRHFGSNITIDGRRLPRLQSIYEGSVNEALLSMMMYRTGRAVVEYVWTAPRRLRIVPYGGSDQNSDAEPADWSNATLPHARVYDGSGRWRRSWGRGTGRGTSVVLHYTPWDFPAELLPRWDRIAMRNWQRQLQRQVVDAGDETDETLIHELVHAAEQMRGRLDCSPLGHNFDTVTEFHAILVTNLLARERNRPARLNHHGSRSAADPIALFPNENEFWQRVETFRARHPDLAAALAEIDIEGNPFVGRAAYRLLHQPWPSELPPF